jgi:hypothetical protein
MPTWDKRQSFAMMEESWGLTGRGRNPSWQILYPNKISIRPHSVNTYAIVCRTARAGYARGAKGVAPYRRPNGRRSGSGHPPQGVNARPTTYSLNLGGLG